jgi:hypothetical protein
MHHDHFDLIYPSTVYMENETGKKFKWKGNGPGMSLEASYSIQVRLGMSLMHVQLYSEEDKSRPIARFSKPLLRLNHETKPAVREYGPATFVLDSRGVEIQDLAVISFLFLEKSRRAREKSTMNHVDGSGVPALSI